MRNQFVMNEEYRNVALTQRIMRRVYWQWFWRREAPALGIQSVALVLLVLGIREFVSVRFVLANAMNVATDLQSLVRFSAVAVQNTGFVTQFLSGAALLLGALLARDLSRALRALWSPVAKPQTRFRLMG